MPKRKAEQVNSISLLAVFIQSSYDSVSTLYTLVVVDTAAAPAVKSFWFWRFPFLLIYLETLLCDIYFSVVQLRF